MNIDTLIFAEKPSQGRAYADAYNIKKKHKAFIELNPCSTFPKGAVITWGIGHLIELLAPAEYDKKYKRWDMNNLPIIPDFRYRIKPNIKAHYDIVKDLLIKTKTIILATDRDREGELIGRLVFQQAGVINKPIMRMFPTSEVEEAIRESFNNLKPIEESDNLYLEAQARQQADWLVGMNLSPLYSLLLQQKGFRGSLSIGRVQCPTVKMIYDRQKEIENFVPQSFYQLKADFQSSNGEYEGVSDVRVNTKQEMKEILVKHQLQKNDVGTIISVEKKIKRNFAPKLHTITTLQSKANKLWKYGTKETLDTVQSLYEKKIVSYPRTDCAYIGDKEFAYIVNNLNKYKDLFGVEFDIHSTQPNKRYVDNSRVEEHYGLIPTQKVPTKNELEKLTQKEINIYSEILSTTLGMFHRDYLYEETEIITDVKGIYFKTKGKIEKDIGWRELSLEKKKNNDKTLPNVLENEQVKSELNVSEGETKPPKRYTEGDLVRLMETAGRRVEAEDGEVLDKIDGIGTGATRAGIIQRIIQQEYIEIKKNVVYVTKKGEILCEAIEGTLLASPTMTAKWETYLKTIGKGQGSKDIFLNNIIKFINKMLSEVPQMLNDRQFELIKENTKTDIDSIAKCPSCEGNIIHIKNKDFSFYGCTNYKSGCKVTFPSKLAGKNMTKTIVKTLCEKGATGKLKGFKNKEGKTFETSLVLDGSYNIKFIF